MHLLVQRTLTATHARQAACGLVLLGSLVSPLAARTQLEPQGTASPPTSQQAPGPVRAADVAAVRKIIQAQLDALQADDAERAFSYATPSIRQQFRTAANFLEMVRNGYPVVHRPASRRFLGLKLIDDTLIQAVRMTDSDGQAWMAFYTMVRQPDGTWRIGGCQVVRDESVQT